MNIEIYDISVIPLIIFLTKVVTDLGLSKKFAPLISLVFGLAIGIGYYSPDNILKGIITGVFLAASSVGFHSGTKNVYNEEHVQSFMKRMKNRDVDK
ncbi:MAG: hypothetical protein FH751_09675 [Firmicutes bacterium]|nr:hypothetical protein [Bacillota bacterium]